MGTCLLYLDSLHFICYFTLAAFISVRKKNGVDRISLSYINQVLRAFTATDNEADTNLSTI